MTRSRDAEIARRNRQELITAKLSRRDLIKLGLLTGSGLLVAKRGLSARAAEAAGELSSPPTTPFVVPLPIPPIAEPVPSLTPAPRAEPNPAAGEARQATHQRCDEFLPRAFSELHEREAPHSFSPELPGNTLRGYNGHAPRPH